MTSWSACNLISREVDYSTPLNRNFVRRLWLGSIIIRRPSDA